MIIQKHKLAIKLFITLFSFLARNNILQISPFAIFSSDTDLYNVLFSHLSISLDGLINSVDSLYRIVSPMNSLSVCWYCLMVSGSKHRFPYVIIMH